MLYTPKSELDNRIARLQKLMSQKEIEGALVIQSADLFYFTGTAQNGHLYVPVDGKPLLMVRKSHARAREETALENVVPLPGIKKLPELLRSAGYSIPAVLGLELDVIPAAGYLLYQQVFHDARIADVSALIRSVRQVKSPYELDLLRYSGRKLSEVFNEIPGMITEGMTELELAVRIESRARSAGHMGNINLRAFAQSPFMGHLMSGANAAVPSAFDGPNGGPGLSPAYPHSGGLKPIGRGEPILADFGGVWEGYITDISRIYCIGEPPPKMAAAFEIALKIQAAVVERLKPGVSCGSLHELALEMAAEEGLADNFMGFGPDRARFLGHGVGLELDELPVLAKGLNNLLEPGMVIAIEPKFVFPGEGVVGIENTFALTEKGLEKLTTTSDELVII